MRSFLAIPAVVLSVLACLAVSAEPQTVQARFGVAKPYDGKSEDICAAAVVVLLKDNAAGETEPVDGQLWRQDKRSGPDCSGPLGATGTPIHVESRHERFRRILRPLQMPDGSLVIGIDGGCDVNCLGGATYIVVRQESRWIVKGDPITWVR